MERKEDAEQLKLEDFYLPFGGGSWIDRDDGCMAGHTGCSKRLK